MRQIFMIALYKFFNTAFGVFIKSRFVHGFPSSPFLLEATWLFFCPPGFPAFNYLPTYTCIIE